MKPIRMLAAALALTVALVGCNYGLAAAAPASALPAAVPAPNPVLGDDVYLYHPILQSVQQKPPLETIIRFRTEAYTNFYPQVYHVTMHIYWWRSARQLHRPRGAWVEIHPTVRYGITSLPGLGQHAYLTPPAEWTCEPGRFFVSVHTAGITHQGRPSAVTLDFPWKGFNRKHLDRGNVHKRPSLRQAWLTDCQGKGDSLIG